MGIKMTEYDEFQNDILHWDILGAPRVPKAQNWTWRETYRNIISKGQLKRAINLRDIDY